MQIFRVAAAVGTFLVVLTALVVVAYVNVKKNASEARIRERHELEQSAFAVQHSFDARFKRLVNLGHRLEASMHGNDITPATPVALHSVLDVDALNTVMSTFNDEHNSMVFRLGIFRQDLLEQSWPRRTPAVGRQFLEASRPGLWQSFQHNKLIFEGPLSDTRILPEGRYFFLRYPVQSTLNQTEATWTFSMLAYYETITVNDPAIARLSGLGYKYTIRVAPREVMDPDAPVINTPGMLIATNDPVLVNETAQYPVNSTLPLAAVVYGDALQTLTVDFFLALPDGQRWQLSITSAFEDPFDVYLLGGWIAGSIVAAVVAAVIVVVLMNALSDWQAAVDKDAAQLELSGYIYQLIREPIHLMVLAVSLVPQPMQRGWEDYGLVSSSVIMIRELLDRAVTSLRKDDATMELVNECIVGSEIMEEMSSIVRARLPPGKTLEVTDDGNVSVMCFRGDWLRLKQVWVNLGTNACKFARTSVKVHFSADEVEGKLRCSVADDGLGMTAEEQNKLFKAYQQTSATVARTHGGTGLGLAISMGLVKMMGGTLEVRSTEGEGSTFMAVTPFEAMSNPQDQLSKSLHLSDRHDDEEQLDSSQEQPKDILQDRVLVLEDDPVSLRLMMKLFDNHGISNRDACSTVDDAVNIVKVFLGASHYRTIVVNVSDVEDAMAFVSEVRKLECANFTHRRAAIVVLVADQSPEVAQALLAAGATKCLVKPCSASHLLLEMANGSEAEAMDATAQPVGGPGRNKRGNAEEFSNPLDAR